MHFGSQKGMNITWMFHEFNRLIKKYTNENRNPARNQNPD
jgi:hypothetical protein